MQEFIDVFAPHAKHDENIADHELHEILSNQLQIELVLELEKNMALHLKVRRYGWTRRSSFFNFEYFIRTKWLVS